MLDLPVYAWEEPKRMWAEEVVVAEVLVASVVQHLGKEGSDVDPNWLYADPDPQNLMNADPDPGKQK